MCLTVKEGCNPEIAQKDIVCYKIVDDYIKGWKPCIFASGARYSYPYNKVLTAESYINGEIHPIKHLKAYKFYVTGRRKIEEGFHAYCKKTFAYMYLCIIPKGTEYCLGEENEIVAVNMIVFRSVLDYCWYKIKKFFNASIKTK